MQGNKHVKWNIFASICLVLLFSFFYPSDKLLFFILFFMLDWKCLLHVAAVLATLLLLLTKHKLILLPCLFGSSLASTSLVSLQLSCYVRTVCTFRSCYIQGISQSTMYLDLNCNFWFLAITIFKLHKKYKGLVWFLSVPRLLVSSQFFRVLVSLFFFCNTSASIHKKVLLRIFFLQNPLQLQEFPNLIERRKQGKKIHLNLPFLLSTVQLILLLN